MGKMAAKPAPELVDPAAVEVFLSILALSVTIVDSMHTFGVFAREHHHVRSNFKELDGEILKLHDALDRLVQIIEENISVETNVAIKNRPPTITNTLLYFKKNDYYRWEEVKDSIQVVNNEVHDLLKKIRKSCMEYQNGSTKATLSTELLQPFDQFLLEMGQMTFMQYVTGLRSLLETLQRGIHDFDKNNEATRDFEALLVLIDQDEDLANQLIAHEMKSDHRIGREEAIKRVLSRWKYHK